LAFFEDPTLTFIGRGVGGDLAKLGWVFNCATSAMFAHKVELDSMTKECGVVAGRQHTLERLAKLTLGTSLNKDPTVCTLLRMSNWSAQTLTAEQLQYAALVVIVPLGIYKHLCELPDLTPRLESSEPAFDLVVGVVPLDGSPITLATLAGTTNIVSSGGA
jgi:ribonuclease D